MRNPMQKEDSSRVEAAKEVTEESSDPADMMFCPSSSHYDHHEEKELRSRTVQNTLLLKVRICKALLSLAERGIGKLENIEEGQSEHLKALLIKIRTVSLNLDQDLLRMSKFAHLLRMSVLERLELLNPDIQQLYHIISSQSYSSDIITREAVIENLRLLRLSIVDLMTCDTEMVVDPVKKEHEAAKRRLSFLSNFLGFVAERCNELDYFNDLVNYAFLLVWKISCLFYLCINTNAAMVNEMKLKMHLSSELHNFSPRQPKVRQIYVKALKSSKAALQGHSALKDEFRWGFLNSLRDDILERSDATPSSFMASYKGQILSLHEDLQILTASFAMNEIKNEVRNPDLYPIYCYFMEQISAAIVDMGCLIYSLHDDKQNEDEEKELKIAFSCLQDTIKIAKEDTKKACYRYLGKPCLVKTKFRKNNEQVTIQLLMKNLKKISYTSNRIIQRAADQYFYFPFHRHEVFHKQLESLAGAFSKLIAKQHLDHEELEIQMTRFCDVMNKANHFNSLLYPPSFWCNHFCLFILLEEIRMIKMEFEDVQNGMMQRKINPQEKQTRIDDTLMISDDEVYKMGEQQMNGSKIPHSLVPTNVGMCEIENELGWLQNNLDFIDPLKYELKALRFSTAFLGVFFNCEGKWHIEDGNLKVLLTRICGMCQIAAADFSKLWADMIQILPKNHWYLPVNMDHIISSVLARLRLLQPDIQHVYTILSESPRFITGISEEAIMKNLNSLLENIDALLKYSTELVAPLKEELETVRRRLSFLTSLLGFTAKRCSRLLQLKDLLILTEVLVEQISCLLYLYFVNYEMNDQMVNEVKMNFSFELHKFSLAKPHIKYIYIKALIASKSAKGNSVVVDEFDLGFPDSLRDYIQELSNLNQSFITNNKDQILSVQEELKFLVTFFAMDRFSEQYLECDQLSNNVFKRINAVTIDVGCMIYSLNDEENNEKMARELMDRAIIMDAKEDIRKMYEQYVPKTLQSNFPRTKRQGFISSLLQKLKELLNTKADLVALLRYHIEIVQKELLSLREDFSKIEKQINQYEQIQHQWTSFLDIAYQIEYVVDSFLGRDGPLCRHKLGLFNVIEDIKKIKIELEAINVKSTDETLVGKTSCLSYQVSSKSEFSKENEVLGSKERLADEKCSIKLVILGEEAEKIRVQLINGSQKLHNISIVGMPGIGKTTLADSVFRHPSVMSHFHAQARCYVSQVFDKRRLLLELLQQVATNGKQNDHDDDDLDQKLYKSLKGRRYLILMDDIWNIQPWEDIKASFPDDEIGSRIIFTSRFQDIATKAGLGSTKYHLSLLSEEKSWEMLQVKLFGSKSCPPELVSVGRGIAANCMGLPLTIDLVAGFLRVKEAKEWKEVAKSLKTLLFEDPERRCRKVLELSYQNLPNDLKPCFLYFAAFPEDEYVPTRDLILLWIAEGFIQLEEDDSRSLEDVAKDILNNLTSRSLIIVSKRGVFGRVSLTGVHDLLHEFVVEKAQEESFLLKTNGKARFGTPSSVGCHDQWRGQYRLCIYPDSWWSFLKSNPFGPRTRSLISSSSFSTSRSCTDFLLNFKAFKLLTVLYIPNVSCHYCPEMFTLVHLRVLAFVAFENLDAINIISKIHKFHNLQSFILNDELSMELYLQWKPQVYLLLDKICKMVRLRHFCFGGFISFQYDSENIWEMSSLFDNLQTLYHFRASYEEDIEKILKLMPNLVELKALFYISHIAQLDFLKNYDEHIYPFPKLDFLMKLESLDVTQEVYYYFPPRKIVNINFPPYLKKLVLSRFFLPWTEISELGNLDTLEILELRDEAFMGPVWEMIDGHQFPKLKHLTLYKLDIEEWNASEEHLSSLEQLHVESCKELKELPVCLEETATLNEIILFHCSESANNSAKRIKEVLEETRNEQLIVEIH